MQQPYAQISHYAAWRHCFTNVRSTRFIWAINFHFSASIRIYSMCNAQYNGTQYRTCWNIYVTKNACPAKLRITVFASILLTYTTHRALRSLQQLLVCVSEMKCSGVIHFSRTFEKSGCLFILLCLGMRKHSIRRGGLFRRIKKRRHTNTQCALCYNV